jgi:Protein of unknown function (DUF3108)
MMMNFRGVQTRIQATGMVLALLTTALCTHAHAETKLAANYTISFARIRVGDITASLVLGDAEYAMSVNGRAGGVMKILMDGEGSFKTRGTMAEGHPTPTNFNSKVVSQAETAAVTVILDEGSVKDYAVVPVLGPGRLPMTEANRQGVIDPLTAMLLPATAGGDGLSSEACRRTRPIFDGHQRYDLKLAFKRMDKVAAEKGYAGPVVVCSLHYEPIAGHNPSNSLVKYLSEGREIEVAFAPIHGTRLLAPFRLSVMSILGNVLIEANQFEATAVPLDAATVADPKRSDGLPSR